MNIAIAYPSPSPRPAPIVIWRICSPDDACEQFDILDFQVSEVRESAGAIAADYYYQWLLQRIL